MMQKSSLYYPGLFALICVFAGCNHKQDVQVYRVSKESAAPAAPAADTSGMPAMPGMPGAGMPGAQPGMATESGPAITSTPPAGWEPQPPTSMRLASFLVKGDNGATADISLVMLGGPAGGGLENVNRWLSQLGQPAINDEKLGQLVKHVPSLLGDVTLVDLEGLPSGGDPAKDGRILGGFISGEGKTIFFKMRGNAALAEAQKENFIKWIATVRMEDSGPATANPVAAAMPDRSAIQAASATPTTETAKPQVKWEAPEGWKSVPASSMRYASFSVTGSNGETADLSVSTFPGEAGGDLQNVNRWRGQIGLEPVTDIKPLVVPVTGKSGEILTVDMTGSKGRILAGWTLKNGSTWFFKLNGPDPVVGGEKEKFAKFLQSIEFQP
jgi:hypothetical protein